VASTEVLSTEFGSHRRALLAHCYRMLGSWDEAEDLVQDTYLRALQGWAKFENRSSVRTWLYRIATNACLTALEGRNRRALPSGLAGPGAASSDLAGPETWIQPIPTAAIAGDPAAIVTAREDVRLALIAGLQYLPPKQRAVLLLRDVLAIPAAEVADVLATSVPAVKSTLQRARARLGEVAPARDDVLEPTEPRARELLEGYMAAWVAGDPDAFGRVLRVDAALEAVPSRTWFAGKAACVAWTRPFFAGPGVAVLTPAADGIARVTVFGDPGLVARFQPLAQG